MDLSIEEVLGLMISVVVLVIMGIYHYYPLAKAIGNWV